MKYYIVDEATRCYTNGYTKGVIVVIVITFGTGVTLHTKIHLEKKIYECPK